MTATPWGFRDILPEEAQTREDIAQTVKGCFREHHCLPVETPILEDKASLEEGGRIADTPFTLFDDDGRLLVVRPDNTLPIVRLVANRMNAGDLPLRLRYEAPVVRELRRGGGGVRGERHRLRRGRRGLGSILLPGQGLGHGDSSRVLRRACGRRHSLSRISIPSRADMRPNHTFRRCPRLSGKFESGAPPVQNPPPTCRSR